MSGDERISVQLGDGMTLGRDPMDRLVLTTSAGSAERVRPVRCFPLSDPGGPVSLTDPDGCERAFVPRLDRLPSPARAFLEREIARLEFVPEILRIRAIVPDSPPNVWHVDTDRGSTSFTLQAESDARRLKPHGLLIVDTRGVRFAVPDVRRLDRHSRSLLAPYR